LRIRRLWSWIVWAMIKSDWKDHAAAQLRKIMSTVYDAREAQDEGER